MTCTHFLIITMGLWAHPMHVAYTNIEIDTVERSVSVSHKAFTNDFALLFFHLFEKNIEPQQGKEFSSSELDMINSYMKRRFILSCDTDTIDLHFSNKEQDGEYLWIFYSGELPKGNPGNMTISHMLFFDLYMDQTNLVIVTNGDNQNGLTFNWEKRQSMIALHE